MARSQIRGGQIKDDSVTGDDVDESTLIITHLEDADNDTKIQVEKTSDEDKIRFDTDGVERMIITETGKVGIGNNITPGYKLDVDGDVKIRGNDIRDSSGDKTITFDGNANVIIPNELEIGVQAAVTGSIYIRNTSSQSGGGSPTATLYLSNQSNPPSGTAGLASSIRDQFVNDADSRFSSGWTISSVTSGGGGQFVQITSTNVGTQFDFSNTNTVNGGGGGGEIFSAVSNSNGSSTFSSLKITVMGGWNTIPNGATLSFDVDADGSGGAETFTITFYDVNTNGTDTNGFSSSATTTTYGSTNYINFDDSTNVTFTEGQNGFGFRSNSGTMQVKDRGGSWADVGTGTATASGNDRSIQFNNNGSLGGGNFFYGSNANVGIGDFSSGNPEKLLHLRGNAGGSGNDAVLRFEDTTHVPTIESFVASGSFGSETELAAGDVVFQLKTYGADDSIGGLSQGYRQWGQMSSIVKSMTSSTDNEGNLQLSISDNGEIEPVVDVHKWGLLIRDQYNNRTDNVLRLLENPAAYINFTNVERSGTPVTGENGFGFAYRQAGLYFKEQNDPDWIRFTDLAGVSDEDQDTYIDPEQSADDDTLRFFAANEEEMTITSSGVQVVDKLGIGTSPLVTLDVKSNAGGTIARISNTQVSGPTLRLERDSEADNQNDVDDGEGIGTLEWVAGGDTWSQPTAKILVEASQNWSLAGMDYGSRMEFFTTKEQSDQQTQRMILNDNVQVKDDLYIDNDLFVSGSQDIQGSIECSSTIRSGTNYTNAIISNNQMGVSNARYLLSYTETGDDRVTVNSNSQNLDFEVMDDAGNSMIYMDAGESRVNLGCPDGQPFASALDNHMDSATTGVYIEGASSESVCTIANTTRDDAHTSADCLALIGGNGVEVTSTYTAGFFFDNVDTYYGGLPGNGNKFVACFYKQHPTGNDRDASLPSSIQYCGGIMGDASGGIAIDYSFTGTHDVCSEEVVEIGMIIESTGELWLSNGMDTSLPYVQIASSANSKQVFGVVAKNEITSGRRLFVGDKHPMVVNSLGEGKVWITNLIGSPSNGDYITSSPISGYGQLQSDDILHSYTVAKLTEAIDWSSVNETIDHEGVQYKKYLAGCTYHCG